MDLDLVPRWEEGVEAEDEVPITLEEFRHAGNNARRVDAARKQSFGK